MMLISRMACGCLPWVGLIALGVVADIATGEDHIVIQPQWKAGDSVKLVTSKIKEKYEGDTRLSRTLGQTPATIEVVEALPDVFRLRITYGKTRMIEPETYTLDIQPQAPMLFHVSREGEIVDIEDWEQVRDNTVSVVESALRKQNMLDDEIKAALNKTRELYATREQAVALLTKDLALYVMPFGIDLVPGQPVEEKGAPLANPFGPEPIPTDTRLVARRDASDSTKTIVEFDVTLDPKETERILKDSIQRWTKERIDNYKPLNFRVNDHSRFEFDEKLNWVIEAQHRREIKYGEANRDIIITRWEWVAPD